MSSPPVLNPDIPYLGEIEGGLHPGKIVRVQGKVPNGALRFAINFQLGPNINPRDDIALHVSPRFMESCITRNHIESMAWGIEENDGPMVLKPDQEFEILILCEEQCYKIAVNGSHYTEFKHRLPFDKVTHLVIDGDVQVSCIRYENDPRQPMSAVQGSFIPDIPSVNFGPPARGGLYPSLEPQSPANQPEGFRTPGEFGPRSGYERTGGYDQPKPYGYDPNNQEADEDSVFGGCLDKVGLAIGGLAAVGGVAAVMHSLNKNKDKDIDPGSSGADNINTGAKESGKLGGFDMQTFGSALASSFAANALHGSNESTPRYGYPSQSSTSDNVLGSLLGALGGGTGSSQQQPNATQQPGGGNGFGGALNSILGSVLGGGGHQQESNQPSRQDMSFPGGNYNYPSSGGYGSTPKSDNTNVLSNIGSAIGSSLLSSALGSLTKHNQEEPHGNIRSSRSPSDHVANDFSLHTPSVTQQRAGSTTTGDGKLTAAEISRGLGLDDDED